MAGHNDRGRVRLASLWWLIVVDVKVTAVGSWRTPGRYKQTKHWSEISRRSARQKALSQLKLLPKNMDGFALKKEETLSLN